MADHRHGQPHADGVAAERAHQMATAAGKDGYLDPQSGLFVMTAAALAAKGTCCDSGCRHCPYCD